MYTIELILLQNKMKTSIKKDIEKQYIEAVNLYEVDIKEDNVSPDIFINLAFIYWEFATEQIEFNIPNNIPEEWSLIGGKRFNVIIDIGLEKYTDNLELKFWKRYFAYRLHFIEFSRSECEQMIKEHPESESLIPYFYLYLFDKVKFKHQRDLLIELCNTMPTAKFNYIKSIIN